MTCSAVIIHRMVEMYITPIVCEVTALALTWPMSFRRQVAASTAVVSCMIESYIFPIVRVMTIGALTRIMISWPGMAGHTICEVEMRERDSYPICCVMAQRTLSFKMSLRFVMATLAVSEPGMVEPGIKPGIGSMAI